MSTIALSLVSHTNVGKTTLARTLARRDVGEVRDEAHVTQEAECAVLIETPEGDRLELWDTPGFGDSVRLARRLDQAGTAIGWFLSEVWDRFRDRAFWSSQRALRNVVDSADIVLYLVDANQPPEAAPWLAAELRVLEKLGKPVIALLNQLGTPRTPAEEAAERERWRARLATLAPGVRDVLALDAFARCWVQEDVLLEAVARALPASRREAADRLRTAWRSRAEAVWAASAGLIARQLQDTATDEEPVDEAGWAARMRGLGTSVGAAVGTAVGSAVGSIAGGPEARRPEPPSARQGAMARLGDRAAERVRSSTDALIRLHGLEGRAAPVVLERVASRYAVQAPLSEGKAAMWGGALTGALAGLKADIATGGLTLGGGLLAGGLLGALGAVGLARGFNLVRGRDCTRVGWSDEALAASAREALLRYLAVAHYGRGRGDWSEGEHPPFWAEAVDAVLQEDEARWRAAWSAARAAAPGTPPDPALQMAVDTSGRRLLARLYPANPFSARGH
jgi:hypothetical protein